MRKFKVIIQDETGNNLLTQNILLSGDVEVYMKALRETHKLIGMLSAACYKEERDGLPLTECLEYIKKEGSEIFKKFGMDPIPPDYCN